MGGAPAAGLRLNQHPGSAFLIRAADDGATNAQVVPHGQTLANDGIERAPDELAGVGGGLPVGGGGRRTLRGEERARRTDDLDRAKEAVVVGEVRIEQAFEDLAHDDQQPDVRGVDGANRLGRAAGVVRHEALALYGHLDADELRLVADAVIVQPEFGRPAAVGQGGQALARDCLAAAQQQRNGLAQGVGAVLLTNAGHAAGAGMQRGNPCVHVAQRHFRQTHVGLNDVEQALMRLPGMIEAQGGQLQAFLVDFGGVGRPAAWRHAADLGPVRLVGGEGDQLASVEQRHHQHDVAEVRAAAAPGVVGGVDVARLQRFTRELVQHFAHGKAQAADEARHALGFRDQLALRRNQAAAHIQHFIDDGALRAAAVGEEHLGGAGAQHVADDFQRERIRAHCGCATSARRTPTGATSPKKPRRTTSSVGGASLPPTREGSQSKRSAASAIISALFSADSTGSSTGTPSSSCILR